MPEICALDVNKGQVISRERGLARTAGGNKEEAPGNLLFVEGSLISISPWEIAANPRLKAQLDQVNERLSRNPQDPNLLTERARLRLEGGELTEAIADLRLALKNNPNKEVRHRARSLLFDALTQSFQPNRSRAEPFLDEYKALVEVDTIGIFGKELAKRQAEQRHRQRSYSMLVAQLRESQGRLREALQAYLQVAESRDGEEMMDLPSEPAGKIRVDVWVRGAIADLLKKATPRERKELEEEIDRYFQKLQKNKLDSPIK
jgi:hypothetical protein